MSTPYRSFLIFVLLTLVLSACNLPAGAPPTANPDSIFTQAAQTVEAQLAQNTQQASSNPPVQSVDNPTATATQLPPSAPEQPTTEPPTAIVSTSAPTAVPATAEPTQACDQALFVADVTVPDGKAYAPGDSFTKTWRLKNTGTCTWTSSYSLVFDSGDNMSGPASQPLVGTVGPGQEVDVSVNLKAPASGNTYRGYWRLQNTAGVTVPVAKGYQNKAFYVEIKVVDSGGGKFAVTSVSFSVTRSGSCASGKYVITATITANGKGEVTYKWIRSDGATDTLTHPTVEFDTAGTKTVTTEWSTSATGLWMDLYVDTPNHQQFGRANLNCP